jgi:hypothetical protein
MADNATTQPGGTATQRITDEDWSAMCDRRDDLDKDIEDALNRQSIRMAAIAINDRAHLSTSLRKAHNMRERDRLATYRKQLDDLKQTTTATGEADAEKIAS